MAGGNPFYVEPANPLQALLLGGQSFDRTRKASQEAAQQAALAQAGPLIQSGDYKGALSILMGAGNLQGATAVAGLENNAADRVWRREEAERAQRNADRSYGLQVRQLAASEGKPQIAGSSETGYYAIGPGGKPTQVIPPARKADAISDQVDERRKAVIAQGLDPNQPHNMAFILSGKMPREDQQPLTATDKKAIMEADEGVLAAQNAVESLGRALKLSPNAYEGPTAGIRGAVTGYFGSEEGKNTTLMNNEVTTNALSQMKAIFGGNPTEGERKVLLDIQGSANQPQAVREEIFKRAQALAQRRLEFNKQRANEMRGGSYFRPNGGGATSSASAATPSVDDLLRKYGQP